MSTDVALSAATSCGRFSSPIHADARCDVNLSTQTVTATNIFPDSSYADTEVPLSFVVTAIRNPRSVRPSTYFIIETTDSEGYSIEFSDNSAFVEMQIPHPLALANAVAASSSKVFFH